MKKYLILTFAAVLFVGCTGSSSGSGSQVGTTLSTSQTTEAELVTDAKTPAPVKKEPVIKVDNSTNASASNTTNTTNTYAVGTGFAAIAGKTFKVTSPSRLEGMTLAFEKEGNFGGETGVNNFFGKATWNGSRINFGKIGLTKMMSDSDSMRNEGEFIALLEHAKNMSYAAGSLSISSDIPVTLREVAAGE